MVHIFATALFCWSLAKHKASSVSRDLNFSHSNNQYSFQHHNAESLHMSGSTVTIILNL